MDILGVGIPEIVLIFLIMLVVAGPRRMTQWAFLAGRELRKLRIMWAEAKNMIRQEMEAAGFSEEEIQQIKNLPNEMTNATKKITNPVGAASKQLGEEIKRTVDASTEAANTAATDLKTAATANKKDEEDLEQAPAANAEPETPPSPEAQAFKADDQATEDTAKSNNGTKPETEQ